MRPLQITVEGFSAYASKQTISLDEVEFFSISGPTGAGKSSLIDAMIFALYGRVPRLGGRAVAPVITAGEDRARVRCEFEVNGEAYVVSRVAERTETGATVREARLETGDGTSLASGAGEVTRAVEDLLRLRFEDFTKTVVLPQGEFARFLNAGNAERRDLLRDLLGLDVYGRVRELAAERKSEAAGRATSTRGQLENLDVVEPEEMEEARARFEVLQALSGEIGEQLENLEHVETTLEAGHTELERLDDARRRLEDITPPENMEEIEERLVAAREAESLATEALSAKQKEAKTLQEEISSLPSAEAIANTRLAHQELAEIEQRIAELDVDSARSEVEGAEKAVEESEARLNDAQAAADAARVDHAAHTVSATLTVGEPCPVCAREVEEIPAVEAPPVLAEVDEAVAGARSDLKAAREDLQTARAHLTELETRSSELVSRRDSLAERVAGAPSLADLAAAEEKLAGFHDDLERVRSEMEDLETAVKSARRDHEDLAESARSMGRALMVAREGVADLKPPYSESDDPSVQWKDFLVWRDDAVGEVSMRRKELSDELARDKERLKELRSQLVDTLTAVSVPAEEPYDVTLARELEVARGRVERMQESAKRAKELEEALTEAEHTEAVAGALANHLRANGFERWLMAGAITGLVNGANHLLAQLSGGGYSLEADEDGGFSIIDHRNADEIRDVATLSGGETFLVSLALALSLAETLSASGGSGLDAIILDEGFGSLDEESLDVVAAVLEELAGKGLMVGVITHVKELAARAPVRYQVIREPGGSKVQAVV